MKAKELYYIAQKMGLGSRNTEDEETQGQKGVEKTRREEGSHVGASHQVNGVLIRSEASRIGLRTLLPDDFNYSPGS